MKHSIINILIFFINLLFLDFVNGEFFLVFFFDKDLLDFLLDL